MKPNDYFAEELQETPRSVYAEMRTLIAAAPDVGSLLSSMPAPFEATARSLSDVHAAFVTPTAPIQANALGPTATVAQLAKRPFARPAPGMGPKPTGMS